MKERESIGTHSNESPDDFILAMKLTKEEKKGLELCQKLDILRLSDNMARFDPNEHHGKGFGIGVELNPAFIVHLGKVENLESAFLLDENALSGIISRYDMRMGENAPKRTNYSNHESKLVVMTMLRVLQDYERERIILEMKERKMPF